MNAQWSCVRAVACLACAALVVLLPSAPAEAEILGSSELSIDFTKPKNAVAKARWSLPDRIRCSEKGLGWADQHAGSWDGGVHVTTPLALGTWWRPTANAHIRAKIEWSGPEHERILGHLFVRHSTDARNWSDWIRVPDVRESRNSTTNEHRLQMEVPRVDRAAYQRLLREKQKLGMRWNSDEEELAWWVESEHPGFLARKKPFLGYVQFLYEVGVRSNHYVRRMDVEVSWTLPGAHHRMPAELREQRGRSEVWRWTGRAKADIRSTLDRNQETRAVLGAALRKMIASAAEEGGVGDRKIGSLVLCDRTAMDPDLLRMELGGEPTGLPSFDALKPGTVADFSSRNREIRYVPCDIEAGISIQRMQRDGAHMYLDLEARQAGMYSWEVFYARHKDSLGIVWVTEPGLSEDGTQAVIHVARMFGDIAGYGDFHLLMKKDGVWTVIATKRTWRS